MIVSSDDVSYRRAGVVGQLEHPAEHRRHELAVGDPVLLDGGEELLRIEALHDHRRGAEAQGGGHRRLRCRVVDGRRRQVAHARAHREHVHHELHHRQRLGRVDLGKRAQDPLRTARRAGRVQHRRAELLVVDRRRRVLGDGCVIGPERTDLPVGVDAEEHLDLRRLRHCRLGDLDLGHRRDEHPGIAVVDDVGDLVGRQVRVDARVVEARALGGGHRLEVAQVVLDEHRHVVAAAQPGGPEEMGQAVGVGLELGERQRLTGGRPSPGPAGRDAPRRTSPGTCRRTVTEWLAPLAGPDKAGLTSRVLRSGAEALTSSSPSPDTRRARTAVSTASEPTPSSHREPRDALVPSQPRRPSDHGSL